MSVVIPTWNRRRLITDMLESLAAQSLNNTRFEVIVVDDGSDDDTADVVEEFRLANAEVDVRCLQLEHGGVNAARNCGVSASGAPVVCFLDDDELAPVDYLAGVLAALERNPRVAGVGGPAVSMGAERLRSCPECSIGDASIVPSDSGLMPRLLGGNMALRSVVFEEVGLFDPAISGRGDETEWFDRAGRDFLYDEDLFVWHRRDVFSRGELCRVQFRQGRALPLAPPKAGAPWRPSLVRLLRRLGHAIVRRCDNGYLLAARELGGTSTWVRTRVRRIRLHGREAGGERVEHSA